MTPPLRVGVVGTGEMGANHCRVYNTLKGVELVAVVDADGDRAATVAAAHDCGVLSSLEEMVGRVDAVSVAVPSVAHAEVGSFLLANGIHCLIEKPLATTDEDCSKLIAAASSSGAVLLVGHIERFNPAVMQLKEILADAGEPILAIDSRRMSAVSSRITDVDVVLDLMVHDLDIVLDMVAEPPRDIAARGVTRAGTTGNDYVTALLTFGSGTLATLTASRVTHRQVRSLAVTTDRRFFTVDYSAQELLIFRQGRIAGVPGGHVSDGRYILDVGTERVFLRRTEPLVSELAHFVACARGEVAPLVGGEDGRKALQAVWAIHEQLVLQGG